MDKCKFKATAIYGHMELKQENRWEDGRLVAYGWSISYDADGKETSRTTPSKLSEMWFE